MARFALPPTTRMHASMDLAYSLPRRSEALKLPTRAPSLLRCGTNTNTVTDEGRKCRGIPEGPQIREQAHTRTHTHPHTHTHTRTPRTRQRQDTGHPSSPWSKSAQRRGCTTHTHTTHTHTHTHKHRPTCICMGRVEPSRRPHPRFFLPPPPSITASTNWQRHMHELRMQAGGRRLTAGGDRNKLHWSNLHRILAAQSVTLGRSTRPYALDLPTEAVRERKRESVCVCAHQNSVHVPTHCYPACRQPPARPHAPRCI